MILRIAYKTPKLEKYKSILRKRINLGILDEIEFSNKKIYTRKLKKPDYFKQKIEFANYLKKHGINIETYSFFENPAGKYNNLVASKDLGVNIRNYKFKETHEKNIFLNSLAKQLGKMHLLGFVHGHPHSGNITWNGAKAGLIDSRKLKQHGIDFKKINDSIALMHPKNLKEIALDFAFLLKVESKKDNFKPIQLSRKERNHLIEKILDEYHLNENARIIFAKKLLAEIQAIPRNIYN